MDRKQSCKTIAEKFPEMSQACRSIFPAPQEALRWILRYNETLFPTTEDVPPLWPDPERIPMRYLIRMKIKYFAAAWVLWEDAYGENVLEQDDSQKWCAGFLLEKAMKKKDETEQKLAAAYAQFHGRKKDFFSDTKAAEGGDRKALLRLIAFDKAFLLDSITRKHIEEAVWEDDEEFFKELADAIEKKPHYRGRATKEHKILLRVLKGMNTRSQLASPHIREKVRKGLLDLYVEAPSEEDWPGAKRELLDLCKKGLGPVNEEEWEGVKRAFLKLCEEERGGLSEKDYNLLCDYNHFRKFLKRQKLITERRSKKQDENRGGGSIASAILS